LFKQFKSGDFSLIDKQRSKSPRKCDNNYLEQLFVKNERKKNFWSTAVGSNAADHFQISTRDGKHSHMTGIYSRFLYLRSS